MALPTAYMTSVKRLSDIFVAIQSAKAPAIFTQKFLEQLEFKAKTDRLIINVLRSLGFIDEAAKPTPRYYAFLDQTQSRRILAQGIRDAYADLFAVNVNAQNLSNADIAGKFRTLTEGRYSDDVISKMVTTFTALAKIADFTAHPTAAPKLDSRKEPTPDKYATAPTEPLQTPPAFYGRSCLLYSTRPS